MSQTPATTQPTNSEPANKILALTERVVQNQAPRAELETLLSQSLQLCAEYQEDFEKRGQARGDKFLEEHGPVLEQVLLHLQHYENGLRHLLNFCQTGEPESHKQGRSILIEVADPLKGVMDYYGQLYMTFGPSDYPLMNTVLLTLREISEGTRPPELLKAVVANAIAYHEFGIKEIEESPEANSEGFAAKKKAYGDIVLALQELKPVECLREIERVTRSLQLALEATTTADEKILDEHLAKEPTKMPAANILINVFKGRLEGTFDTQQLQDATEWYRKVAEELEEQFELALEGKANSAATAEELPRFRELLDRHDEILSDLEEHSNSPNSSELKELIDEFEEVIDDLFNSARVFVVAAEREGKLICVKCGHANPHEFYNCGECGHRLPKMAGQRTRSTLDIKEQSNVFQEEQEPPYEMGQNTYKLLEAAGLFHEGSIDEDAFRAILDESRSLVENSDDEVENYAQGDLVPEHMKKDLSPEQLESLRETEELFEETKELLQTGMDEWYEALNLLEEYIETRHYPLVEKGCEVLFVASQKMHKVSLLGEKAEKAQKALKLNPKRSLSTPEPASPTPEPEVFDPSYHGYGLG